MRGSLATAGAAGAAGAAVDAEARATAGSVCVHEMNVSATLAATAGTQNLMVRVL
jgi:hypothetical protein